MGVGRGLRQGLAHQHDMSPPSRGAGYLGSRREGRHNDGSCNSQQVRVPSHRLGMVASRHGNNTPRPLVLGQHSQPISRTTFLERAGNLEIVQLQHDIRAGQPRNRMAVQHRCPQYAPSNPLGRLLNVLERDHRYGV